MYQSWHLWAGVVGDRTPAIMVQSPMLYFRWCLWNELLLCYLRNNWFESLFQTNKSFLLITESSYIHVRGAKMSDDIRKRFEFPNSLIQSQVIFIYLIIFASW